MQGRHDESAVSGSTSRLILMVVAGLVATILGLTLSFALFGGAEQSRRGGSFQLVDHLGAPADESVLKGRLSLVYFGFTHCPDICPTDLANAVAAREMFQSEGGSAQIVFVSVDPERDTPDVLESYVGAFGDDLIGLTGSAQQIAAAAKTYGVVYAKSPPADPDDPMSYEILHSADLFVVGADAKVLHRFPSRTPPPVIARRLKELASSLGTS